MITHLLNKTLVINISKELTGFVRRLVESGRSINAFVNYHGNQDYRGHKKR